MKVHLSISSVSKLNYVLGSIVATALGQKIRPLDAIFGSGSRSCHGTVARWLHEHDPELKSTRLRVLCFGHVGDLDDPLHCMLVDGPAKYKILVNTWESADFVRRKDGTAAIVALDTQEASDGHLVVISDMSSKELLDKYGPHPQ